MIVSGESKTGQTTQSRGRGRRGRGGGGAEATEAVRPCEAVVGEREHHHNLHHHPVGSATWAMASAPIVVDDEDDDVVVSSPTAFAQAKLIANADRRLTRQSRVPVPEEDPLELRLGMGGASHYNIRSVSQSSATQQPSLLIRRGRQARPIDLTTPARQAPLDEDCVCLNENPKSRKRKNAPVEAPITKAFLPNSPLQEKEEERKLRCVICLDTMKDETSTTCGHIFCQSCIQGAIKAQKKCPTCRKKLTMKNIHRIYI